MSINVSKISNSINQQLLSHHIEIKPCPCCGSNRIKVGIASANGYHVKCTKCGIRSPEISTESLNPKDFNFSENTYYEEYESQVGFKCCQKALEVWNKRIK